MMLFYFKRYAVYFLLLVVACGGNKRPQSEEIRPASVIPFTVIVEKEISGKILGQNLNQPYGLAKDYEGNIYLSDAGNDRIIRFNPDLKPLNDVGGYGKQAGLLSYPTFIAFDNGLNLMVSDERNRRVSRYNKQLNFVDAIEYSDDEDLLKFGYPSGIAFTDYGETWIADRDNDQVAIFNNVGQFENFLGDYGASGILNSQ